MWDLGQGQALGKQDQARTPTSGLLDPLPDTKGPLVLITFKKLNSNLFPWKLLCPQRPPGLPLPLRAVGGYVVGGLLQASLFMIAPESQLANFLESRSLPPPSTGWPQHLGQGD